MFPEILSFSLLLTQIPNQDHATWKSKIQGNVISEPGIQDHVIRESEILRNLTRDSEIRAMLSTSKIQGHVTREFEIQGHVTRESEIQFMLSKNMKFRSCYQRLQFRTMLPEGVLNSGSCYQTVLKSVMLLDILKLRALLPESKIQGHLTREFSPYSYHFH
jgi:hypothetical protein